jgi:hypothetical protein
MTLDDLFHPAVLVILLVIAAVLVGLSWLFG